MPRGTRITYSKLHKTIVLSRSKSQASNMDPQKRFKQLLSTSGILGCIALVVYFSAPFIFFPFSAQNASAAEIIANATQYQDYYLLAAWLQGTGTFLIVLFVVGLVYLANAWNRFASWVTMLASSAILLLSLMEGTFFLGATLAVTNGHPDAVVTSFELTFVFLHAFFIAPSLLLPLAFVLRASSMLPKIFWRSALVLGIGFETLGFAGLFLNTPLVAIILLILMIVWIVAAAVRLAL